MHNADFSDRTYTTEVMRTKTDPAAAFKIILKLTHNPRVETEHDDGNSSPVNICHAYLATKRDYHRFPKRIFQEDGEEITIPRRATIKGQECNLYDVFIAQYKNHIVVAVPFHELAEEFFVRVDRALAGTNTSYDRLNITNMVLALGSSGNTRLSNSSLKGDVTLSVTRCHLTYADQKDRTANIQQIRMTGANLGLSKEYESLIAPVLRSKVSSKSGSSSSLSSDNLNVTPVILGFALLVNGVRKSSATTDRHGNFKLWIAPGLRRLIRLFGLLDVIESMKGVTSSTSNVPILQSKTIRDAED